MGGRSDPLDEEEIEDKKPSCVCIHINSAANRNEDATSTSSLNNVKLFKTKSSKKFERRLSRILRQNGIVAQSTQDQDQDQELDEEVPAGRYFDALQGPELEVLKDSEDLLLPKDQLWPFLLRFPANAFGIGIGMSAQSLLWAELKDATCLSYLHIEKGVTLTLWSLAVFVQCILFITYLLKFFFYFEAVRREYYHPVRINYFFAPWVAAMLITLSTPKNIARSLHPALLCVFMIPVFGLELKVYGQWLFGGNRRLSKVANPTTHLALTGNFVGALLSYIVNWKELAFFLFAVGIAHYMVLFVTLYQRHPTNVSMPLELHPVFFLFFAAPSIASEAWEMLAGKFDMVAKFLHFLAIFLFMSMLVRINLFRGFRFSLAWWAYTFPVAALAMTQNRYCLTVPTWITKAMTSVYVFSSVAIVAFVLISSLLHAFVWGSLFPNDPAIAIICNKKQQQKSKTQQNK